MENDKTSEEKSLPPSRRKLRELRRKGYVSRSPDMISAAALAVALIYCIVEGDKFVEGYKAAIEEVSRQDANELVFASTQVFSRIALGLGVFISTLLGLVILSTILSSILVSGGLLFSVKKLQFNINNLNPFDGFKRMFSMKAIIDLFKRIVTLVIFVTIAIVVMVKYINEPFYLPTCGLYCFQNMLGFLIECILLIAVVLFLLAGLVDINIQRWLFERQHRMTRSEARRDRKEEEGSPELRTYQRRLRQGILQTSNVYGPADATIMIEGKESIVGVRYIRGETPLPIIVCKGKGRQLLEFASVALDKKIYRYFDDDLASNLYRSHEPGSTLNAAYFDPFIRALKAANIV